MGLPLITNIQKYSIHDGDGIRTTVFFKGCPLSCLWCHNPETQSYKQELLYHNEKCTGCQACIINCPEHAIVMNEAKTITNRISCTVCGQCVKECLYDARTLSGQNYEIDELVKELMKDMMFYEESGGGVTLSGGEVMAQDMDYIEELIKRLSKKGCSVTIDTCGYAPYSNFQRILPYTEQFLYDIKAMSNTLHQVLTGKENQLILDNLVRLNQDKARIYLRLPLIADVNDNEIEIRSLIIFLKNNRIQPVMINLLPYHDIGKVKYRNLQKQYIGADYKAPSKDRLEQIISLFQANGYMNVRIGG